MCNSLAWIIRSIVSWYCRARDDRDDETVSQLFYLIVSEQPPAEIRKGWIRIPRRLHAKAWDMMRNQLNGEAQTADTKLTRVIGNVRLCDYPVSEYEEKNLYRTAFRSTESIELKIHFAKLIHGGRLPLPVLCAILEETDERSAMYGRKIKSNFLRNMMRRLVREMPANDEQTLHALLEIAVAYGRYRQLLYLWIAAGGREKKLPKHLIRTCLEVHLTLRKQDCESLTGMCIALQDWTLGNRLIEKWKRTSNRFYARSIECAMNKEKN